MGLFFKKRHIKTWNIYAVIYEFNENISSPLTLSYIITWKTPSSSCKIWYFGNLEPWEKKQLHSFPLWGHKDISYIIFRNKISVYIILLFWFLLNRCGGFAYVFLCILSSIPLFCQIWYTAARGIWVFLFYLVWWARHVVGSFSSEKLWAGNPLEDCPRRFVVLMVVGSMESIGRLLLLKYSSHTFK